MCISLCAAAALGACSPSLDWRDVRAEDTGLRAQFPCRPSLNARRVVIAGQSRLVHLMACSTAGATWALAWAYGIEPAQMGPALRELREAAASNVRVAAPTWQPLRIPGATPQQEAAQGGGAGQRPDGTAVQQRLAVFSRGTTAFQATVLSDKPLTDAVDTFFGALRFPA